MRKLLIGALVMALPVLMLGQESVEQSLAREAREWEEALKVQRMIDEYLGQMKLDAQSILDDLKAELERKQSDMKWELYMQEEELRLERNRLLRELEDARFVPDADVSGTPMIGTGTRGYIALALHCDNCVWLLPRVSPTGKLGLKYTNDKETQPAYEFDVYEDPYSPIKTTAWYRYPIV